MLGVMAVVTAAKPAAAANIAALAQPPAMFSLVIFLLALVCLVFSLQVLSFIRGGYLSKSWQFFLTGFILLALAQLSMILDRVEVMRFPEWLPPALLLLMAGAFLLGLMQARKQLG